MNTTILQAVNALLGVRSAALPLSRCRIVRPYLLDPTGIGNSGTALFFAVPYLVSADIRDEKRNVSLYAVPRDYHGYIRQVSAAVLPPLHTAFPSHSFALFSDHSPLDEVDGAARAGLGVVGQNGLLITETYGSYVFIAELITGAPYETVTGHALPPLPDTVPVCIGCGACMRACPGHCTQRDKTGCLSALTQQKGELTPDERAAVAAHPLVWGCDVCQTVCPMNRTAADGRHNTTIPYFLEDRLSYVTAPGIAAMDKATFSARAFAWRSKATILRNLTIHDTEHKEDTP